MHLAIDAVGIKHSGGATVLLDFLAVAAADNRVSKVTVFASPRASRRFEITAAAKIMVSEQGKAERSYPYRIVWYQWLLTRECQRLGANILFCMTGEGTTSASVPHVTFIQQPLPFTHEFAAIATKQERLRMGAIKLLMLASCRYAKRVIVQTPTMKAWVTEQLRLPEKTVEVVLPSVRPLPALTMMTARLLSEGPRPRLLYVGSAERYKNVEVVLKGLPQLRNALPGTELYLTWPQEHPAGRQPGVHCLGHLSREQLAQAYGEADLLVMPSLIETVGLPILEAMASGAPVLVADRPYARDIAEDAALFFDPLSADDFVQQAQALLDNSMLRDELIRKGRTLAARRAQAQPYQRMLDIVLECGRDGALLRGRDATRL